MSLSLGIDAKRTLFADSYKAAYQSAGPDARPYVTFREQMGVDTYKFRKMGRGMASARGASQSQLNVMGIDHDTVDCTLASWVASELTDVFDQDKTNAPQEVPALAGVIARAVKRRETQVVIDAIMTAYNATLPTGHSITESGSVGLTVAKILSGRKLFKKNDIMETPTLWMTETQEYDLLQLSSFTSADFAASGGASTGNIKQGHFGCNYLMIGSGRDEDGLSLIETDDRVCFMTVPSALGLVVGLNKTEVNYESNVASWRSTGMLRAGAVAIDTLGIVSIECDE